jgi:8-amino-7-oxononanoate synthase
MNPSTFFEEDLEILRQKNLYRTLRTLEDRGPVQALYEGREITLFCGNDYLGLSHHPRVIEALKKSADQYGAGSGAARLISGTSLPHEQLEIKIAQFKNKESALVYTAGYLANVGAVTALAGEKDLIVMDKLCHASLIDGARLSGAEVRVFPHKNYERCEELTANFSGAGKIVLISDTIFSMDGDFADLSELIRVKKKYGALLIVDDAHGTGIAGASGRGATEGYEKDLDVITGTLSKAVGTVGGFVATSKLFREVLINTSRPFIFATSLPPSICAAADEAFRIFEALPELRKSLQRNLERLRAGVKALGWELPEPAFSILPLLIGAEKEAVQAAESLLKDGFLVPAVRTPSVAKGKARLRLTVSAAHTPEQMDSLLKALGKIIRTQG